jgi:hypothetical protein
MISIFYEVGCRECLRHDGMKRMYTLMDGNFEKYQKKPEYEVVSLILKWIGEDRHTCPFCGSTNLEVHDVFIDDYRLFDFERLGKRTAEYVMSMMINIDKRNTSIIPNVTKTVMFDANMLELAIKRVFDFVKSLPDNYFIAHSRGNFYIAVSASYLTNPPITIERFTNHD